MTGYGLQSFPDCYDPEIQFRRISQTAAGIVYIKFPPVNVLGTTENNLTLLIDFLQGDRYIDGLCNIPNGQFTFYGVSIFNSLFGDP